MNNRHLLFFISIFVLFLIISGCSSTKQITTQDPDWQPEPQEIEEPPPVVVSEEIPDTVKEVPFDPVEFADDGLLIPRQNTIRKPVIAGEEIESVSINADTTIVEEEFEEQERQGYRVQIFSTIDNATAKEVEQQASMQFSESVYVTYDPPYYKVRVGDCLERDDADNIRQKAISIGYRDAWVVRDKINLKVRIN